MYKIPQTTRKVMKLLDDMKFNVGWYHYSARHKIALVSSNNNYINNNNNNYPVTSATVSISGFYIRHKKIIKMPRFDVSSNNSPLGPQVFFFNFLFLYSLFFILILCRILFLESFEFVSYSLLIILGYSAASII